MISEAFIEDWRIKHPWPQAEFVEQDLILSRLIVELYRSPIIAKSLLFRGGTALHKVFIRRQLRYSEDLDFVQLEPGPIGTILTELRKICGQIIPSKPIYEPHEGRAILKYRFQAELPPNSTMKIKIEINTREHFAKKGTINLPFECESPWFSGTANVSTFHIDEILATKLRALYQRRKGRDLFDLFFSKDLKPNHSHVVELFKTYMKFGNYRVTRSEFESNLQEKLDNERFHEDILRLIHPEVDYDVKAGFEYVMDTFISKL